MSLTRMDVDEAIMNGVAECPDCKAVWAELEPGAGNLALVHLETCVAYSQSVNPVQ